MSNHGGKIAHENTHRSLDIMNKEACGNNTSKTFGAMWDTGSVGEDVGFGLICFACIDSVPSVVSSSLKESTCHCWLDTARHDNLGFAVSSRA